MNREMIMHDDYGVGEEISREEIAAMLARESMSEEMTEKQRKYIQEMQEFSPYRLPRFEGHTKKEASEYIDKWHKLAHENMDAYYHGFV